MCVFRLTGTLAISETTLKDVMLMLIEDLNASGGLLGRNVSAVVKDPASNWPLFADMARELVEDEGVDVVFGCWTSVSRKSVLPVFEALNSLLFYPVQYEGEEASRNVFYTGAAPNQQAIPAVDYLYSAAGGSIRRFALVGTDYVYPRTTNTILESYLQDALGIPKEDILISWSPFGQSGWELITDEILAFAAGTDGSGPKPTAVVSTINGDANIGFYAELARKGISASTLPVIAFSVGEEELSSFSSEIRSALVGHYAAWNYFQSMSNSLNDVFIARWDEFTGNTGRVTNDPMEAHYIGFNMWVQAVKQAGTTNVDAVRQAMYGQTVRSLSGYNISMGTNHHLSKPVIVGRIRADGQFDVVEQTSLTVDAVPWSPYFPGNGPNLVADWSYPYVCGRCYANAASAASAAASAASEASEASEASDRASEASTAPVSDRASEASQASIVPNL